MLRAHNLGSYLVLWLVAVCVGCNGGRLPVTGFVKYPDGSPVPGGTIIAESEVEGKLVSVQGNIEPDGKFELGGAAAGDGALPGSYRAMIMPVALGDSEMAEGKLPTVGGKYSKFESSGIVFEVAPGMSPLAITVDKPVPKKN